MKFSAPNLDITLNESFQVTHLSVGCAAEIAVDQVNMTVTMETEDSTTHYDFKNQSVKTTPKIPVASEENDFEAQMEAENAEWDREMKHWEDTYKAAKEAAEAAMGMPCIAGGMVISMGNKDMKNISDFLDFVLKA
jgi:hypothetical protein